jgi:hypothetical protein
MDFALLGDGQRTGDLALGAPEACGVIQLASGVLKAQTEQLAASGTDVLGQLTFGHVTKL